MNKVSVSKDQNPASPDKGTGPLGCGLPVSGRGAKASLSSSPLPASSQTGPRVIFGIHILVNDIFGLCIFGYFSRATTFLFIGRGICP